MSGDNVIPRFSILLITGIIFLCIVPTLQIGFLQAGATAEIYTTDYVTIWRSIWTFCPIFPPLYFAPQTGNI